MGDLTDALLSLAHVSRTQLTWEAVDLAVLAREAVERLREQAPGRNVQVQIAPTLPVRGDPRLLRQVMENLIGNAFKFSARVDAPAVRVGVEPGTAGAPATYFVADNGAGFDMAFAHKLFGTFQRLHAPSEFAGTGIGLANVHRIVVKHGGRIWAESAPGQGATFRFTLAPAAPDAPVRSVASGG
jgi:light-regulated signal transduction histidine kinase (bacteriophytochrome)